MISNGRLVLSEEAHGRTFAVPQGTIIEIKLWGVQEWAVMPLHRGGSGMVSSWSVHDACDGGTTATFVARDSVVVDAKVWIEVHYDYRVTIVVVGGES
jgi:hypothetical protein